MDHYNCHHQNNVEEWGENSEGYFNLQTGDFVPKNGDEAYCCQGKNVSYPAKDRKVFQEVEESRGKVAVLVVK